MTLINKGSYTSLPRLDVPPEHEAIRQATPPDLKGLQFRKIPKVGGNKNNDNRSNGYYDDDDDYPVLLPDMDEPHPYPYIITPAVRLVGNSEEMVDPDDPWGDIDEEFEEAAQYFLMEIKFSRDFLEEILPELTDTFVRAVASNELGITQDSDNAAFAIAPQLDDIDYFMFLDLTPEQIEPLSQSSLDEEIIPTEVREQSREVIWEMIDEKARSLPSWKIEEMKSKSLSLDDNLKVILKRRIAFDGNIHPRYKKEDQQLNSVKLESIIFEYHHILSRQRLTENFALTLFQDNMISRALADMVTKDGLDSIEQDLKSIENEEMKELPPRS